MDRLLRAQRQGQRKTGIKLEYFRPACDRDCCLMEISLDDFRRHFELLSDETLLSTNREELVAGARPVYDEEIARRGLNSPAIEETPEAVPDAVAPVEHEE